MSVTCRLTDEVIARDDLARRCKDICADEHSFDAALMELCRQKRCALSVGSNGEKVCRTFALRMTYIIDSQFESLNVSMVAN